MLLTALLLLPFTLSAQTQRKQVTNRVKTVVAGEHQRKAHRRVNPALLPPQKMLQRNVFQGANRSLQRRFTTPTATRSPRVPLKATGTAPRIFGSLIFTASWYDMYQSGNYDIPYGMYSFTASADDMAKTLVTRDNDIYATGGGTVVDGVYHFVNYFSYQGQDIVTYYEYDAETWELLAEEDLDGDMTLVATDLTYEPINDEIYGCFYNADGDGYVFGYVDYSLGYVYEMADLDDLRLLMVAANEDGDIFAVGNDGKLYQFDADYGDYEEIGETGVSASTDYQSGAFDPRSGELYWAAQLTDGTSALYIIDTETGEAEKVADFPDNEQYVGLYIPEPEAEDDAPAAATNVQASFEGGATTGSVSFTIPTKTYAGGTLTGDVSYTIYINDTEAATGTAAAGATVTEEVTAEDEGEALVSVVLENGAGTSPAAKTSVWVGADEPKAPTDVRLMLSGSVAKLSWTAPTEGVHGGYVDPDQLTYDIVRYPDNTTVASGLSTTYYQESLPAGSLQVYYYAVTARQGEQQSAAAQSNRVVSGDALEVPYEETFDNKNALDLFTVLDKNNDGDTWEYGREDVRYYGGSNDADDWLVTPAIKLRVDRSYRVKFQFNALAINYEETLAFACGQGNDPTTYDLLLQPTTFNSADPLQYDETITVEHDGDYHFAFHALSEAGNYSITIDNLSITEGTLFTAPGEATDIVITPAAMGALSATIAFKAPTKTYDGQATLTEALTKIEVKRGDDVVKTFGETQPGAQLSFVDDTPENGENTYTIIAYAGNAAGEEASATAWIGIDEPEDVTNVKLVDTGSAFQLTWNAPTTTVGLHGGYFDPSALKYTIYTPLGEAMSSQQQATTYLDNTTQNSGAQRLLYYYVSAVSAGGEGWAIPSNYVIAGTPDALPFEESFAGGGLDNQLWWLDGNGRSSFVVSYMEAQDNDGGCAQYVSDSGTEYGELNTRKLTLAGTEHPMLLFHHRAKPGIHAKLTVQAYVNFDHVVTLKTIDYSTLTGDNDWRSEVIDLSSLKDSRYVSLSFRGQNSNTAEYIYLDHIAVRDMQAHDLGITLLPPSVLRLGNDNEVKAVVENRGSEPQDSYAVNLLARGKVVATLQGSDLASNSTDTLTFNYRPLVTETEDIPLQVEVVAADDMNESNNKSETVTVKIQVPTYPAVDNLTAEADGSSVDLAWTAPVITSEPITDDFESYEPWLMDGIGNWTVVDRDGAPTFQYSDIWVPNAGKPMAFEVFNTTDDEFDLSLRKFLIAHSGVQYLIAFNPSPSYQVAADDWLISPKLSGEAQTVSFYAKSLAANYPDNFEVLYSTTDTNPESFTRLHYYEAAPGGLEWTKYDINLPAGAKYFAIRDISYDCLGLQVDDVTYRPHTLTIEGYNIYRNGQLLTSLPATATSYKDTTSGANTKYTYTVSVVYDQGESQPVSAEVTTVIRTATWQAQQPVDVYTVDGKQVARQVKSLRGLQPGIYVVDGKTVILK